MEYPMPIIRNHIQIALEKHQLYLKTVALSRHDTMTGALSRSYLSEQIPHIFDRAKRYNHSFSLVLFDLNNLKKVNDNLGHSAGDVFISTFAKTTLAGMRSSDLLARWGGDEFVGLFYEIQPEDLDRRMANLQEQLSDQARESQFPEMNMTFSWGAAHYTSDGTDFQQLLSLADQRMYQQKSESKAQS